MLDGFGAVSKGDGGILSKLKRKRCQSHQRRAGGTIPVGRSRWAAPALRRDIEIGVPGEGLDVDVYPRRAACGPLANRRVRATDGYGRSSL